MIKHPFHTVTAVLVALAVVQSVVLLVHGRPTPAHAPNPVPSASHSARPTTQALLVALQAIGPRQHSSPQRTVIDEIPFNGKTVEVKTIGTVETDVDMATLSAADITVRPDGVATVTLSDVSVHQGGKARQWARGPGVAADWTDVSQIPGLGQVAGAELARLTGDGSTACAAPAWVQPIVAKPAAAAGFPAVIVQVGMSC